MINPNFTDTTQSDFFYGFCVYKIPSDTLDFSVIKGQQNDQSQEQTDQLQSY